MFKRVFLTTSAFLSIFVHFLFTFLMLKFSPSSIWKFSFTYYFEESFLFSIEQIFIFFFNPMSPLFYLLLSTFQISKDNERNGVDKFFLTKNNSKQKFFLSKFFAFCLISGVYFIFLFPIIIFFKNTLNKFFLIFFLFLIYLRSISFFFYCFFLILFIFFALLILFFNISSNNFLEENSKNIFVFFLIFLGFIFSFTLFCFLKSYYLCIRANLIFNN